MLLLCGPVLTSTCFNRWPSACCHNLVQTLLVKRSSPPCRQGSPCQTLYFFCSVGKAPSLSILHAQLNVTFAPQPEGSTDTVMLVSSATTARWKKGAATQALQAAESFRIARVRSTNLRRAPPSDYRFEERGGLTKGARDTVLDELS